MPLLTRYILTEHLKFMGLLLGTFLMIFLTIHGMEKMRGFIQTPGIWIVQYFLLKIPKMMSELMPMVLFLATLLTLATLSRNNEMIPMMNAGMRMTRWVVPFISMGGVASLLFIFLSGSFIPYTLKSARTLWQEKTAGGPGVGGTFLQNRIWFRLRAKRLLSVQLVDSQAHTLYGVHLYDLGNELPLEREVEARSLSYEGGRWIMVEGLRREYQKDGAILRFPFSRSEVEIGQTLAEIQRVSVRPDEMTLAHLTSYIRQLQADDLNARPYLVALYAQRSFPWTNLILAFLGVSISLSYFRSSGVQTQGVTVLLGLGTILLYWLLISVFGAMGRLEGIPPIMAGWGPHLLMLTAGLSLFIRYR